MRKALAALLCGMLTVCACGGKDTRPNVVLIIVDTLRADVLGCYGNRPTLTPNMDRLAAGGAMFYQCISAVPVTLPSVATILTSSYPMYHGARDNGLFVLDESIVTMAEAFKEAGYATGAVVGSRVIAEQTGIAQGFDFFDSKFSGAYLEESSLLRERSEDVAKTQRRAQEVTERAVAWLERAKGPFFLLVHYFDPHSPYDPPPEFLNRYGRDLIRKYLGEVAYTDERMGPLMEAAEAASGRSDLLTVFVADHGEGLKEHGESQHGFFLYDSTVRVPFILHFPGHIVPAMVVQEEAPTIDIAPTVLDLVGLSAPQSWQGETLAPKVTTTPIVDNQAPAATPAPPRPCYMETFRTKYSYNWSELFGVRHNMWKYVRAPRPELYDLAKDPRETENVYDGRPDVAAKMEALLDDLIRAFSGPLGELGPSVDLDEEEIEKLEALGYVMPQKKPPTGPLPDPKDQIDGLNMRMDSKELVQQARTHMHGNDLDKALEELEKAVELDPKNSVAVHDIGAIYFKRGEFEKALPYFEEAVQISPTKVPPRENLAMTYMKLEKYEDAARELETAVALEPAKADLRLGYGLALLKTGDPGAALLEFRKAIELDPDLTPPYYQAALILAKSGQLDLAAATLREMLSKNPPQDGAALARKLLSDIERDLGS